MKKIVLLQLWIEEFITSITGTILGGTLLTISVWFPIYQKTATTLVIIGAITVVICNMIQKKNHLISEYLSLSKIISDNQQKILNFLFLFDKEGIYIDKWDWLIKSNNITEEIEDLVHNWIAKYNFYGGEANHKKILITKKGNDFYNFYATNKEKNNYRKHWKKIMQSLGYSWDWTFDDFKKMYQKNIEFCWIYQEEKVKDIYEMHEDKFLGFLRKFYQLEFKD